MINQIIFIIAAVCILALCYIIALKAQPRAIAFYESSPKRIQKYLFSRFSWPHVTFSTVGSYISFYIIVLAAFVFPLGWGSLTILGGITGVVLGFGFLYWRVKAVIPTWKPDKHYTYVDLIQERIGNTKSGLLLSVFPIVLMTIYVIGSVSTELRSIELFYTVSDMPASDLLTGEDIPESPFRLHSFILIACVVYVFRGGFRGVINTDKMQLALFGLLWLVSVAWMLKSGVRPLHLLWDQLYVARDPIIIAINSVILFSLTIGCILDNWIRSAGTLISDCSEKGIPRAEWPTHVRRSLVTSATLASILFLVPGLLGLQAREVLHQLWKTPEAHQEFCQEANTLIQTGEGLAKTYMAACLAELGSNPPLLPRGDAENRLPTAVESAEDLKAAVKSYTDFTNSPLILTSLFMREFFNQSIRTDSEWFYLAMVALVIVAFLCAVLTTVDSYLVSVCQLLSKLGQRRFTSEKQGLGAKVPLQWRLIQKPGLVVIALAVLVVAYSQIELLQDPSIYISVGFFAYIALIYLFFIAVISTHGESGEAYNDTRPLTVILILYLLFIVMFIVHILLIGDIWIPDNQYSALLKFIRSRAYLILFPTGALTVTTLYYVWKRKRASRGSTGALGGSE